MITKFILDIKNKLTETAGSALMSVVLIFTVLLILIGSTSTLALNNYKKSVKSKNEHALYYLAEARLNEFDEKMLSQLKILANDRTKDYSDWTNTKMIETMNSIIIPSLHTEQVLMGMRVDYDIQVIISDNETDKYIISSTASLDNESKHIEKSIDNLLKTLQDVKSDDFESLD